MLSMKDTIKKTLIDHEVVRKTISELKIKNVGLASIREIVALINSIERETGEKFIRMEMGVPGLPASPVGIDSQVKALKSGAASHYPNIEGIRELKIEISRFIKLFLNAEIPARCCFPCSGSTNGSFISFLLLSRFKPEKNEVLFLDPGFPVHKHQLRALDLKYTSVDVYECRGERLRDRIEEILSGEKVGALLYSNPNNPAWVCFTGHELELIGNVCSKYDVTVIEDLAYFNMDFRNDYSKPGEPPHQPTIAHYTDNFILLISSSKIFSYAGERIGAVAVSEKLYDTDSENLVKFFGTTNFGHALIYGAAYAVSAGVTHSSQYALAAMLKAANDDDYHFLDELKIYAQRAKWMKESFLENGFRIVYDRDNGTPIGDGFYFTVSYPEMYGDELAEELLYYGISAISLSNTGSTRKEGIRACVSLVENSQIPELEKRLRLFHENHR